MKKLIIRFTIVLISLTGSSVYADNKDSIMQKANAAYQAESYEEAIFLYESIIEDDYEGAVLFYNLGNAYYKAGENAKALLWYERALRLEPSNENIKHNISFVNQKITDKIDVLPEFFLSRWWNAISMSLTPKSWAICAIVFCFALFICIAFLLFSQKQWVRSSTFIITILSFLLLTFSIIFAQKETSRYKKEPEGIIMKSVVSAKSTPNQSGADLFIIHEGLKVTVTDKVDQWYEIKIPNGEKGWIPNNAIEVI